MSNRDSVEEIVRLIEDREVLRTVGNKEINNVKPILNSITKHKKNIVYSKKQICKNNINGNPILISIKRKKRLR